MNKLILYLLGFLVKGWEVSILLILPILQTQGKINVFELGLLASVFSLFQIAASFFSGNLSHKLGSHKVMTISILLYGLAWAILGLSSEFVTLLLIYAISGLATGVFIPLANSQIAKISDKNRAKEMGDFSAFSDIGRVTLSALTTFLISSLSIFVASMSHFVFAAVSALILKRVSLSDNVGETGAKKEPVSLKELIKNKKYLLVIASGIGDVFASASLFIFIPLLLLPKGVSVFLLGFFSALFFAGYLFGRMLLGRSADKYGSVRVLMLSQVLMAVLTIILIFTNQLIMVALVLFLLGIFTRGTSPVIRAMSAEAVFDKHKFDKAFGFHSFCLNISNIASRFVYGFLAAVFGISSVFYFSAMMAFLTLIPLFLYSRHSRSLQNNG